LLRCTCLLLAPSGGSRRRSGTPAIGLVYHEAQRLDLAVKTFLREVTA
jgi:hypothetical protein